MPLPEHNIEREFAILQLTLYLQANPDKAAILAVNHYEDGMSLADDYKQLRAEYERLQQENIRLKSQINHQSPSLPTFVNFNRGVHRESI